jgi:hypothetical protein
MQEVHMAKRLDRSDIVTFEELLMSVVIPVDAVTQLLFEKGFFTELEFFAKLKEVQQEYQSRRAAKT